MVLSAAASRGDTRPRRTDSVIMSVVTFDPTRLIALLIWRRAFGSKLSEEPVERVSHS